MDIIVLLKRVPDLVEDLEVDDSGKALDEDCVSLKLNEFDDYALEEALLLKEAGGGSVTGGGGAAGGAAAGGDPPRSAAIHSSTEPKRSSGLRDKAFVTASAKAVGVSGRSSPMATGGAAACALMTSVSV